MKWGQCPLPSLKCTVDARERQDISIAEVSTNLWAIFRQSSRFISIQLTAVGLHSLKASCASCIRVAGVGPFTVVLEPPSDQEVRGGWRGLRMAALHLDVDDSASLIGRHLRANVESEVIC
jgi:hypothetical protein